MSTAHAKFTFDVDMSRKHEAARVIPDAELAAMLEVARLEGHTAGFAEGEKSDVARAAQAILSDAGAIARQGAQLTGAIDQLRVQSLQQAVDLGKSIGHKLTAHLLDKHPTEELEVLITECMSSLDKTPHLLIRCHPDLADAIKETTENQMATSGFSGRLVVMGDPEINIGDGRIEWADGGLVRDTNAMNEQIDQCIHNFLDTHGISTAEETEQ